jgi:hypothetical protein
MKKIIWILIFTCIVFASFSQGVFKFRMNPHTGKLDLYYDQDGADSSTVVPISGWYNDSVNGVTYTIPDNQVGIGTSIPNAKLTVDGSISRTGTMYGTASSTHINLGDATSVTGESGQNYSYASVLGGFGNTAKNDYATVIGHTTTASGYGSFASGYLTTASGLYSFASGSGTTAGGAYSFSRGVATTASGAYSVASGRSSATAGDYSWVGGRYMQLSSTADNSFVWGHHTSAVSITEPNVALFFPSGTAGKVGIGTATPDPDSKLDVYGDYYLSGSPVIEVNNPSISTQYSSNWKVLGDKLIFGDTHDFIQFIITGNFDIYTAGNNWLNYQDLGGDDAITFTADTINFVGHVTGLGTSYFDLTGTVLSTKDAITSVESASLYDKGFIWTARAAAEANPWYSVAYGNGLFVAVANNGTNRVMTSPDGVTWIARSAAGANQWQSVTYGNGLFVAVSSTGTNRVMTSPDGVTWIARSAAEANEWRSVTYGNGLFVAVSDDGTNRVMTSPDGVTWIARSAAEANEWRSVTYGNGLFVAVSITGTNQVMTSPDGVTWIARSAAEANAWQSVTYGNGLFVAVSYTGTNRVMTSPDGMTWIVRSATEANPWLSVTYGNGLFVAVSTTGTHRVMTSGYPLQTETPTKNIYQGGMVIQGDVGIGTTSPQEKLDIGYASGVFLRAFRGTTDTDITGWIMTNENGDTCYVYPNAAGNGIEVSTTKP